eukprot:TRINITY_DN10012_c0_g1_i1.p1 TRINITY_DN10012_c0_g1~~TRINITY_DN10012_c0_g1_i1.p1  ORF type:complete len:627 (+),score=96.55 TRINITY_DN10012_c0_g1_i1:34-1881(+)
MGCCGGKEAPPKTVSREDVVKKRPGETVLRREMPVIEKVPSMSPKATRKESMRVENSEPKLGGTNGLGGNPTNNASTRSLKNGLRGLNSGRVAETAHKPQSPPGLIPPVEQDDGNELQTQGSGSTGSQQQDSNPPKPVDQFAVSQHTDFRISHGALTGLSDYESDILSDTDPYGYHQTAPYFDQIDEEDYDSAQRNFMTLIKSRESESDKPNLVALLGLSTLHGLGGDVWIRTCSNIDTAVIPQMGECEKWLKAYSEKRGDTAAPLLALCELYHARGDKKKEAEYLELAKQTGHPLALLRCATEHLNSLKKRRDRSPLMTEDDVADMEGEKRKLLGQFLEISKHDNRVGAKAGKYLWVSYRRGSDGFPKDLQKAAMALERAVRYQQGKDNGQELQVQLGKIKERINQDNDEGKVPKRPKKTPPPSPNDAKKVAWSTPAAHSPAVVSPLSSQSPLSPLRRGSSHVSPVRSDSSSSLKRGDSLKRSDSQRSQIAVAVATINGVEVCAVKDFKSVGRTNDGVPLSPSRRGKVSSYDRDFLENEPEDAQTPSGPAFDTASQASKGRRMSERGRDLHNRMRRESTTPAVPAFHAGAPGTPQTQQSGSSAFSPRRVSLKIA